MPLTPEQRNQIEAMMLDVDQLRSEMDTGAQGVHWILTIDLRRPGALIDPMTEVQALRQMVKDKAQELVDLLA